MSEHRATVEWQRSADFRYETYSRAHPLRFDGISVPLSSCHLLWFLHLACPKQRMVERYVDEAVGVLDKTWSGKAPTAEELRALHHPAHGKCFIANSVKTEVLVEPC